MKLILRYKQLNLIHPFKCKKIITKSTFCISTVHVHSQIICCRLINKVYCFLLASSPLYENVKNDGIRSICLHYTNIEYTVNCTH